MCVCACGRVGDNTKIWDNKTIIDASLGKT